MNAIASPALQATAEAFLSRHAGLASRMSMPQPRARAANLFRAGGLPTPRDEAWHYTSLASLAGVAFAEPVMAVEASSSLAALLPDLDASRVVFVDGRFDPVLSRLPVGISVRTGAPDLEEPVAVDRQALVLLNTMLAEDGATIDVAAGIDGGTLLLASLGSDGHGRAVSFHPRHTIRLGAGARLTLIEAARGEGIYLHNPVLVMRLADGATLTHLRLQDEAPGAFHLSAAYAAIAAGATYDSFTLARGGRLARGEIHARLLGPGAAAHLNAAQLLAGSQHTDFTTVIAHDAPSCNSRQTVKTVLSGRSRGVFQGKIEVARAAQKTDGYQMNQALLLSAEAEMDSKPQLEIYADDVKCSHGATTGSLDPEQAFYLRSRGIPEGEARAILVRAFLAEALDPIAHDAGRAMLEHAVSGWWENLR